MARNLRGVAWSASAAAAARRLCTGIEAHEASLSASAVTTVKEAEPSRGEQLYRRLSALGGAPEGAITKAVNKWLREGRRVTAIQIMRAVKELRKYGRFQHALELMEWMDTRGMNMSYSNYAVRLGLISRVQGIESAEIYFSNLSKPAKNQLTYGALLNCYCNAKMEDKALELFEKLKEQNYASNALSYTNIMSLYMKLGKAEKVPPLVLDMKEKNIAPNYFTYSILLNSYAALNDLEGVEQTFEEIKESSASGAKWPIYVNLASFYISAGLVEKAESALRMLEENMDRGDRQCFHFLISLYARAGSLEGVNRVWNSLKSAFPTTINMSYFTMLISLNRLNEFEALEQCFHEWESGYTSYDIRLANVLFGAYIRRDMLKEAESLRTNVVSRGSEPDSRTFDIFISYYLDKRKIDLALHYMDEAASMLGNKEWKPDKEMVDKFLKYFEEQKDVNRAEAFCKILKKLNCLDSYGQNSLLRVYLSAGKLDHQSPCESVD